MCSRLPARQAACERAKTKPKPKEPLFSPPHGWSFPRMFYIGTKCAFQIHSPRHIVRCASHLSKSFCFPIKTHFYPKFPSSLRVAFPIGTKCTTKPKTAPSASFAKTTDGRRSRRCCRPRALTRLYPVGNESASISQNLRISFSALLAVKFAASRKHLPKPNIPQ
jgi:hypothetical protein